MQSFGEESAKQADSPHAALGNQQLWARTKQGVLGIFAVLSPLGKVVLEGLAEGGNLKSNLSPLSADVGD
jgi:hypothetical protein